MTLTTPTYPVKVAKGISAPVTTDEKEVENKNSDIRHIYLGDKNPVREHSLVVLQSWYWLLYLGLIILTVILIIANRRKARLNADVLGQKTAQGKQGGPPPPESGRRLHEVRQQREIL